MPRVNLSISQELYDKLQNEAERRNLTVNHLILSDLQEKYGSRFGVDYMVILDKMIDESKEMSGDFVLSDLPSYAGVESYLIETRATESTASVRARLGKMYNELVRKNVIPEVNRVMIEKNGVKEPKFASRAAVYARILNA